MAGAVEAEGWDGQVFMDSQSLGADPYVLMGAWAMATERIKLATGVTNPLSRHIAVTAGAAVTLQQISRGRAVLGIGRGDSALAYLGYGPVSLTQFHRALTDLQTLLTGGEIAFEAQSSAPSIEALSLAHRPSGSRLKWLPADLAKVPLDVAASGPRVIEMAALLAERATFSVGVMPERLQWAVDIARAARTRHALSESGISYGAQVIVVCHPDREAMLPLVASFVAPLARFQVIQGAAAGPTSAGDEADLAAVRSGYDMTKHDAIASHEKIVGTTLTRDFVQRFAIVEPPDHCIERLLQLRALGIDRFVVVGPGFHPEATYDGGSLFAREVMPAIRQPATYPPSTGRAVPVQ